MMPPTRSIKTFACSPIERITRHGTRVASHREMYTLWYRLFGDRQGVCQRFFQTTIAHPNSRRGCSVARRVAHRSALPSLFSSTSGPNICSRKGSGMCAGWYPISTPILPSLNEGSVTLTGSHLQIVEVTRRLRKKKRRRVSVVLRLARNAAALGMSAWDRRTYGNVVLSS